MKIVDVRARQIYDSRGFPTVEADVILEDQSMGRAAVPSGASTGINEAVELRDEDKSRFLGKGVSKAVENVNTVIREGVKNLDAFDQSTIDHTLIKIDGTENKCVLGANAILAVSLAAAKAAAVSKKQELYDYIKEFSKSKNEFLLPVPMINIINGGKHAAGSTDIQEFMIMPIGAPSLSEALRWSSEIFHSLHEVLSIKGYGTTVGDEGGFAPHVKKGNTEAVELILESIEKAGYTAGEEVVLALDVAASELYKDGAYHLKTESRVLTTDDMVSWIKDLTENYPIVSVEDGLDQEDWESWKKLNEQIGKKIQLVGDDLFVTNTKFLQRGIDEQSANAVLVKLNQIGTLTETLDAIAMADAAGWKSVVSHRSGETEDTTISHVVVGMGTGQIKTGSMSRSDRMAKYNELLRIEENLGQKAAYPGWKIFKK